MTSMTATLGSHRNKLYFAVAPTEYFWRKSSGTQDYRVQQSQQVASMMKLVEFTERVEPGMYAQGTMFRDMGKTVYIINDVRDV